MRNTRRGFTLIELLVVISLIALLLAVLLPALSAARDTAIAAVCLTQQRQVATASVAYAIDFRDLVPPMNSRHLDDLMPDGDRRKWDEALGLGRYLPLDPIDRPDDSVQHCPQLQRLGPDGMLYQFAALGGVRQDDGSWAISQGTPGAPLRPVFDGRLFYGPAPTRIVDSPSRFILVSDPAREFWPGAGYTVWIDVGGLGRIGLSVNAVGRQVLDPTVNDDWYLHREAPNVAMLDGSAGVVPNAIRELQHRYLADQPVTPGQPDLVEAGRYFYPKPRRDPWRWTEPLH